MPDPRRLCQAFVHAAGGDVEVLGARLVAMVEAARAAWPGVDVAPDAFVAFVAERVVIEPGAGAAAVGEAIDRLRTADLWLACSCSQRDAAGLAAFERAYGGDVDAALAALGTPAHVAEEARQVVRTRLFVAAPGAEPVIARYGGRGDLRAWVRATTVRAAIDLIRCARREVPSDDEALDAPIPATDPELARLRERYGEAFKQAFGEAFAALTKRDRTLLRYRYVDELDIDGIGAVYRVHRSTAARWLQRIRDELLDATRARLAERLAVSTDELDSILRFIGSELDVSISSVLGR